jgi:hypothetical protein
MCRGEPRPRKGHLVVQSIAIRLESEIEPSFEKRMYDPFRDWLYRTAGRMRSVQRVVNQIALRRRPPETGSWTPVAHPYEAGGIRFLTLAKQPSLGWVFPFMAQR